MAYPAASGLAIESPRGLASQVGDNANGNGE